MSSIVARCSHGVHPDQGAGRPCAPALWPVSSRGVLAAVLMTAAVSLGAASRSTRPCSDEESSSFPDLVLDPNTAPQQVLLALPHAGPTLVGHVVEERDKRPFVSVEDARRRVIGLGPSTLAKLAPYLRFQTARGPDPDQDSSIVDREAVVAPQRVARRAKARVNRERPSSSATRLTSLDSKTHSFPTFEIIHHD